MARTLLTTRGIPFQERTVNGNQDVEALQKLSGQTSLPLLTIGTQQLPGFSDTQWAQYLDAAGYPQQSKLPPGYAQPEASPLVPPKPPADSQGDRRNDDDRPIAPTIGNPPEGFRF